MRTNEKHKIKNKKKCITDEIRVGRRLVMTMKIVVSRGRRRHNRKKGGEKNQRKKTGGDFDIKQQRE
jgi:hypothetical protein